MSPAGMLLPLLLLSGSFAEPTPDSDSEPEEPGCLDAGLAHDPADPDVLLVCTGPGRAVARVPCRGGRCPPAKLVAQPQRRAADQGPPPPTGPPAPGSEEGCAAGPGLRCSGCDTLLICVASGGGRAVAVHNYSCAAAAAPGGPRAFCDPATHTCRSGIACPEPSPADFLCLLPGLFPDPADCKRYHVCDGPALQHYSDVCEKGYDPVKQTCAVPATGQSEDKPGGVPPVPPTTPAQCDNALLPGKCDEASKDPRAFKSAKSLYRVCLPQAGGGLRPAVLTCPEGQTFNDASGSCAFSCDQGSAQRVPDPDDCHGYYECAAGGAAGAAPKHLTCSKGLAFHPARSMCIPEKSVPSCVSLPPPATAQPPVLPDPTPRPPTRPDVCIQEGVFPDPTSCTRYIACTRYNGVLTRSVRYCPFFMSFSAAYGGCRVGLCY